MFYTDYFIQSSYQLCELGTIIISLFNRWRNWDLGQVTCLMSQSYQVKQTSGTSSLPLSCTVAMSFLSVTGKELVTSNKSMYVFIWIDMYRNIWTEINQLIQLIPIFT